MTQDIVERLLAAQVPYDPEICAQDYWESLCEEAADTIAALRKKVAEAGKMLAEQNHEYNRKTNALIERHAKQAAALRAELELVKGDRAQGAREYCALMDRHDAQFTRAEAAEAEMARLKEASDTHIEWLTAEKSSAEARAALGDTP